MAFSSVVWILKRAPRFLGVSKQPSTFSKGELWGFFSWYFLCFFCDISHTFSRDISRMFFSREISCAFSSNISCAFSCFFSWYFSCFLWYSLCFLVLFLVLWTGSCLRWYFPRGGRAQQTLIKERYCYQIHRRNIPNQTLTKVLLKLNLSSGNIVHLSTRNINKY